MDFLWGHCIQVLPWIFKYNAMFFHSKAHPILSFFKYKIQVFLFYLFIVTRQCTGYGSRNNTLSIGEKVTMYNIPNSKEWTLYNIISLIYESHHSWLCLLYFPLRQNSSSRHRHVVAWKHIPIQNVRDQLSSLLCTSNCPSPAPWWAGWRLNQSVQEFCSSSRHEKEQVFLLD